MQAILKENSMSKEVTPTLRRALRGKAHALHPVVLIGDNGLTEAVLREIEVHLHRHELIKIRAQSERDAREAMLAKICEQLSAQPVQHIGKTLVIYRERPSELSAEQSQRPTRPAARPATRRAQSKRAADRARKKISVARAPAAAPARRRARIR